MTNEQCRIIVSYNLSMFMKAVFFLLAQGSFSSHRGVSLLSVKGYS